MRKLGKVSRRLILTLGLTLAVPTAALAYVSVIDPTAIAKLTDQLTKLQEQINALNGIKDKVQEQIDAVGEVGKISLPLVQKTFA